jgi:vacuolar-type H+-ATPase catalytic subunit A/Vma1
VKTKNDWAEMIQKDKKDYGINLTDEEISCIKKSKFKRIVEEAVTRKALEDLNNDAERHSKSANIMKANLKREKYLDDPRFSRSDAELLFSLRTRMIDVKKNFSKKYGDDMARRTCKVNVVVETQDHIFKGDGLTEKIEISKDVVYEDIFKNVDEQLVVIKIFKKLLREREILLNSEN